MGLDQIAQAKYNYRLRIYLSYRKYVYAFRLVQSVKFSSLWGAFHYSAILIFDQQGMSSVILDTSLSRFSIPAITAIWFVHYDNTKNYFYVHIFGICVSASDFGNVSVACFDVDIFSFCQTNNQKMIRIFFALCVSILVFYVFSNMILDFLFTTL